MRIERIEMVGFKSFAAKTVLKFHPGTTAIVGPNGCGKSNVVDAFKWGLESRALKVCVAGAWRMSSLPVLQLRKQRGWQK